MQSILLPHVLGLQFHFNLIATASSTGSMHILVTASVFFYIWYLSGAEATEPMRGIKRNEKHFLDLAKKEMKKTFVCLPVCLTEELLIVLMEVFHQ